jgi:hypothetical protein
VGSARRQFVDSTSAAAAIAAFAAAPSAARAASPTPSFSTERDLDVTRSAHLRPVEESTRLFTGLSRTNSFRDKQGRTTTAVKNLRSTHIEFRQLSGTM